MPKQTQATPTQLDRGLHGKLKGSGKSKRNLFPPHGQNFNEPLLPQNHHSSSSEPQPVPPLPVYADILTVPAPQCMLLQVAQRVSHVLGYHDDPTTRELCLDVLSAVTFGTGGLPRGILLDIGRSLRSPFLAVRACSFVIVAVVFVPAGAAAAVVVAIPPLFQAKNMSGNGAQDVVVSTSGALRR